MNKPKISQNSIILYPSITTKGAKQMAIDEMMLIRTSEDQISRFRFYYWSAPTISLGYFQDYYQFCNEYPELSNLDIVRRLTGGGAILHDKEITYCITIPSNDKLYKAGPIKAYTLMHQIIINVFKKFGQELILRPKTNDYQRIRKEPEFCFERGCPTDIISPKNEKKIVGSAQRRLTKALMQHGSIMLDSRFTCQTTLTVKDLLKEQNIGTISKKLENLILNEITSTLDKKFEHANFTEHETEYINDLTEKYTNDKWTIERENNSFISHKNRVR